MTTDTTTDIVQPRLSETKGSMKTTDLSKLISPAAVRAKLKKAAERVNQQQPLEYLNYQSDKASMELRKSGTNEYKPRIKAKHEALPPTNDWRKRPVYVTGDGDSLVPERPGSMDFKKWPSKGFST